MTKDNSNFYDFIISEDDEIMLLLYARDSKPQNPRIEVNLDNKSATLYRSENDGVSIEDISDEILDILYETDKLLICELSNTDNEDDTQIVNAYEAEVSC